MALFNTKEGQKSETSRITGHLSNAHFPAELCRSFPSRAVQFIKKNAAHSVFAARQVSLASVSIILFSSLDARQCSSGLAGECQKTITNHWSVKS